MEEIDIKANQKLSWFKINFNSSLLVHVLLGFYFNIYQSKIHNIMDLMVYGCVLAIHY